MTDDRQQQLVALQQTLYRSTNPTRRWLHRVRRDWVLAQIAADQPHCTRALEVGPGSGVYLAALLAVADEVVAADIEQAYLQRAAELAASDPRLHCRRDDITRSTLPAGSFDLILCSEVIEHLPDSGAALHNLARLLAPGGRLLLTTPQRFSPLELCARVALLPGVIHLTRRLYREPVAALGHINLLTESALKRQLRAAGLVVEVQHKTGFYLPLIAEFLGVRGQRVLRSCERALRDTPWSWLLWTQCYRLRRE